MHANKRIYHSGAKMIRNFFGSGSEIIIPDPGSSLGMNWFPQLRLDQIWIKTTSGPKILFMFANKRINPVVVQVPK